MIVNLIFSSDLSILSRTVADWSERVRHSFDLRVDSDISLESGVSSLMQTGR